MPSEMMSISFKMITSLTTCKFHSHTIVINMKLNMINLHSHTTHSPLQSVHHTLASCPPLHACNHISSTVENK